MKWFTNILVTVLIVCPSVMLGQTYFNQRFPPEPGSWGSGTMSIEVLRTSYCFNRWSVNSSNGYFQHDLCQLDSVGDNLLEFYSLRDTNNYYAFSNIESSKSGVFYQATSVTNYSTLEQRFGLMKFDSTGLNYNYLDSVVHVMIYLPQFKELPNGDLIMVGVLNNIQSSGWQTRQLVVIKTDSLGHQIWKKTYRLSNNSWQGECIALAPDGGFFIGGAEVNYNVQNSFTRGLVMKLDSNGNRQWHRFFGDMTHSSAPVFGITATPNGGCAFVGGVGLPEWFSGGVESGLSPWIVGLDDLGLRIWADTNTPEQASYGVENFYTDIESLPNGSFVVTGQRDIWDNTNTGLDKSRMHGVIAKYSSIGEPQWVRNYRHPEVPDEGFPKHLLFDIDPTPDGGFVAAGYLNPSFDNTQDTWVLKVDSFGCLIKGCEVTSVPKIESSVSSVRIYPNPASEVVHFDITPNPVNTLYYQSQNSVRNQTYVLKLYDITGKLVLTQLLNTNENTINVAHLKPGVYSSFK